MFNSYTLSAMRMLDADKSPYWRATVYRTSDRTRSATAVGDTKGEAMLAAVRKLMESKVTA